MSDHKKSARIHVQRALSDALTYGFDDVVSRPLFWPHFELDLLRKNLELQNAMKDSGLLAFNRDTIPEMQISPIDYFFRPKARFLQRRCAYVEPQDIIKYLALALSIAANIEKNRVDRRKNIVHSYRYNETGETIFSKKYGYGTFRNQSKILSSKKKFKTKIITDIANFYDRVNIHRIESQLLSIGCDKDAVRKLNDLLLTWNDRDSYGLPVGGNASRILAEAALMDIDRYLIAQNITFIRFVDDFRIFASGVDEAAYLVQILQTRLSEDGLTLNSEKTHVVPTEQLDESVTGPITDLTNQPEHGPEKDAQVAAFTLYKGRIPLSYRDPSEKKLEILRSLNVAEAISQLERDFSSNIDLVKDVIRAIVIQGNTNTGVTFADILRRYIEIVPYAVDMMIEKNEIPEEITKHVSNEFEEWLLDGNKKPDYVITSIIRLLISKHANGRHVVARFLEKLPRHGSTIVGREIFLSLMPTLDRSELLQIKRFYRRATPPEKRAIIKGFIENSSVHAKEKEAWLKAIRATSRDIFIGQMIASAVGDRSHSGRRKKKQKK